MGSGQGSQWVILVCSSSEGQRKARVQAMGDTASIATTTEETDGAQRWYDALVKLDRLTEIVLEVARQDDIRGINCSCRETMPVGHYDDCYVFRAHMLAHQSPDGSYE